MLPATVRRCAGDLIEVGFCANDFEAATITGARGSMAVHRPEGRAMLLDTQLRAETPGLPETERGQVR
jgi:hypothetical protein